MAVIKKNGGFAALPINIKRGNPIPLDASSIWYDKAALEAYAKTDVTAYVGQIVTYVDEINNTSTVYVIKDIEGNLLQVGAGAGGDAINVDENTIILNDDGLLTLRDFGQRYYKYIPAVKDETTGEITTEAFYELQEVNTEYPWKIGLIPQVTQIPDPIDNTKNIFVIGWYEPNPTTVDGLQTAITALQTEVAGVKSNLSNNYYSKEELAGAIRYRGTVENADDLQLKTDAESGDLWIVKNTQSEYIYNGETWEELGSQTNLSDFDSRIDTLENNTKIFQQDITQLKSDVKTIKDTTIPGLQAIVDGHTTSITKLNTEVADLKELLGKPASTSEDGTSVPATGVFNKLQVIENSIVNFGVTINGTDAPESNGKINLFDFTQSGNLPGLVPVPSDDIILPNAETYMLTAKGKWEQPRDTRIGTLTYGETHYTTVTDYVDARVNDVTMVWSKIVEEE